MTMENVLQLPAPEPELRPETLVVCTYRLPAPHEYAQWTGPLWVGVVEEPGIDPAQWNKHNSEADYCRICRRTRVRYEFGIMHDFTENLLPITAEQAALAVLPHAAKNTLLCSLFPTTISE